ncbi:MAG TPA: SPW repeat protein, partial [Myxococcota bacterium]|nr:SPW repeat protein [Myxococcota bacterium]
MKATYWQDWVLLAVSGWLFFSPMVLGFATLSHPAAWVAFVSGLLLFVSASEALVVPGRLVEWLNGGVGIALMASPWVLGYSTDVVARANSVGCGLLVTAFAIAALARDRQMHEPGH